MITKFSRKFWETAVAYKGSKPSILKSYDIMKMVEAGKSLQQIAIKTGVTKQAISKIVNKYGKPNGLRRIR